MMCNYCKELQTGDCNDSIIEFPLKLNDAEIGGVDIYIGDDRLIIYVDTTNGDPITKHSAKIKYCPMCGASLDRDA